MNSHYFYEQSAYLRERKYPSKYAFKKAEGFHLTILESILIHLITMKIKVFVETDCRIIFIALLEFAVTKSNEAYLFIRNGCTLHIYEYKYIETSRSWKLYLTNTLVNIPRSAESFPRSGNLFSPRIGVFITRAGRFQKSNSFPSRIRKYDEEITRIVKSEVGTWCPWKFPWSFTNR